ncbi:MAG: leucine--tRNA ligase [Pirellulales bacterium]
MPRYNPAVVEPKWQRYWEENETFRSPRLPSGEKLYVLDMFPYPSGDGLHVGHPEGYTATDIVCRYSRMRGRSVMHPMGFDAFGLPAEEHAIRTNTPPRESTERNIDTFRRQLKMLGFSYDWSRELATTDVEYVRWTQWIFLQIYDTWFDETLHRGRPIAELPIPADVKAAGVAAVRRYQDEHRLAFQSEAPVNWCPALGTVLANEEVIDGKSERGGHPVERRPLRQWMLRITAYADRLERDLEALDWPESVKLLQRNWIGRSTGAEVDFYIGDEDSADGKPQESAFFAWKAARAKSSYPKKPGDAVLRVYTTRPDTLFGATYMVIAPEHPLVDRFTLDARRASVDAYRQRAAAKSDLDRTELAKSKTGVFTGSNAINPVNGKPIPIWIADYVLMSYGTGAIMAVPGHDQRDFEFAQLYDIPVVAVVDPGLQADVDRNAVLAGKEVFAGNGVAVNSPGYDGQVTPAFKKKIAADLARAGLGREAVNYKLRDWLFSRQRFWGEPFPILHEVDADGNNTGLVRAVDEADLPVNLPHLDDYKPHGRPEPPLDKSPEEWLYPVIDGQRYKRETNTMPQWAGSCWYYLRYLDNENTERMIDPEVERAWMPVDLYIGGAEHAVLHLLYSRFWHKVLFDRGVVSTPEPFAKLVNQGMILGEVEYHMSEVVQGDGQRFEPRRFVSADDKVVLDAPDQGRLVEEHRVEKADVEIRGNKPYKRGTNYVLSASASKMSKSRGNVVNPDQVVREYGADALRLYEMFMGPIEAAKPWSMDGVSGVRGFLDRVWRLIVDDRADDMQLSAAVVDDKLSDEQNRVLHKTIKAVTEDVDGLRFNTAIARMMEFTNYFTKLDRRPRSAMERLVLLLAPFAPHMAEELWALLGHRESLSYEPWPTFDEAALVEDSIEVPVQVNGKVRGKVTVANGANEAAMLAAAKADEKIAAQLAGKLIVKQQVVRGPLVFFVVK